MAKDKGGHGSEAHAAHKASHGPSGVEHGSYGNGKEYHGEKRDEGRSKPPEKWTLETSRRRVGGTYGT